MSDKLKSAVELAMEKLDREMGTQVPQLSDDQRTRIADVRSRYAAKKAETEIAAQGEIRKAQINGDFQAAAEAQNRLAAELLRLEEAMGKEVTVIREE